MRRLRRIVDQGIDSYIAEREIEGTLLELGRRNYENVYKVLAEPLVCIAKPVMDDLWMNFQ